MLGEAPFFSSWCILKKGCQISCCSLREEKDADLVPAKRGCFISLRFAATESNQSAAVGSAEPSSALANRFSAPIAIFCRKRRE
jgi:hypothetical protein